jgi:hypothetical protein
MAVLGRSRHTTDIYEEQSEDDLDLFGFGMAFRIYAKTIGSSIAPVVPLDGPTGKIMYLQ